MKRIFQSLTAFMLLSMATGVMAGAYTPGTVGVHTGGGREGLAVLVGSFNVRHNAATGRLVILPLVRSGT